jgi:hypothetical protein
MAEEALKQQYGPVRYLEALLHAEREEYGDLQRRHPIRK